MNIGGITAGIESPALASSQPASGKEDAQAQRARRACKDFESILLYHMLSTMRKAFGRESETEGGFGGGIFRSMMDEQLSLAIARAGGIGLADLLEKGLGLDGDGESGTERVNGVFRRSSVRVVSDRPRPEAQKAVRLPASLKPYDATIRAASKAFGVGADLIRAVIMQESAGDSRAVSPKGAKGLMQLMDGTARELGVKDSFDPIQNIFGGARLLGKLLKAFGGNLELALASYNAGRGAVEKYGGIPPFKETRAYVRNVIRNLEGLRTDTGPK